MYNAMKWLRNILKGASLTTALFIFQACYGTPQDALYEYGEAKMSFTLLSGSTGEPLEGIHIKSKITDGSAYGEDIGVTGKDGSCEVKIPYMRNGLGPFVRFEDPENNYTAKDTVFSDLRERNIFVSLADN